MIIGLRDDLGLASGFVLARDVGLVFVLVPGVRLGLVLVPGVRLAFVLVRGVRLGFILVRDVWFGRLGGLVWLIGAVVLMLDEQPQGFSGLGQDSDGAGPPGPDRVGVTPQLPRCRRSGSLWP